MTPRSSPKRRRATVNLVLAAAVALGGGALGVGAYLHAHDDQNGTRSASGKRVLPSTPIVSPAPTDCRQYDFGDEADQTQEVQSFVNAAVAAHRSHRSICISPNLNLLVSSTIVVSGPALLDFRGATITKAKSLNGFVLAVDSPGVTVTNLDVDGDRNGGGGILWQGPGGQADNDHVVSTVTYGFEVQGAGSSLFVRDSSSDDNVTPGFPDEGSGFAAQDDGRLVTDDTSATNNGRSGYLLAGAASGSRISGTSGGNYFAGLEVRSTPGLDIADFTSTADWHYGVYLGGVVDCSIGSIRASATGKAQHGLAENWSGAGVEFFAARGCVSRSIDILNTLGYGIALGQGGGRGSDGNTFQDVNVTRTGNPGINISGSSSANTFVSSNLTDVSMGVSLGPNSLSPTPYATTQQNDGNVFDKVVLVDNGWTGISINSSSFNVFGLVSSTDTMGRYPANNGDAVVRIIGDNNAAEGNVISELNVYTKDSPVPLPQYIVYSNALATGNWVRIGVLQGGYSVAPWIDPAGRNTFFGP